MSKHLKLYLSEETSYEITKVQPGHGLTAIGKVTNSSDKVKSKPKPPALVAVRLFENAKDFEVTNNVFNGNA